MKKFLIVFCLLSFTTKVFAQQFSQYNTGTLFDSFENPAQKSFVTDSSRKMASNFFIPNSDLNFYITGDAQQTLKNRAFLYTYKNSGLDIGSGKYNYVNTNANAYIFMFKLFTSFNGNEEIGFFAKTQEDGRGAFTDESIALLNGSYDFKDGLYNNLFNSRFQYQVYNEYGFSYREQLSKRFALGFRVALVSGVKNESLSIDQSQVTFDKMDDAAQLILQGTSRKTSGTTFNPLRYPGASISIGTLYKTKDGFVIQGNIKNLGFVHWSKFATISKFNGEVDITDLTSEARESNVYTAVKSIINSKEEHTSYSTPLDGRGELSASKTFYLDGNDMVTYTPTVVASKELFYNGFTGAIVNPIGYKNYSASLTASYDDMKLLNIGGQLMIKSPNAEFFIGSDRLFQSAGLLSANLKSQGAINQNGSFTGADFFIGFSMKFGEIIEHPMNASNIPMGVHGFLGRLWQRIFKTNEIVEDGW